MVDLLDTDDVRARQEFGAWLRGKREQQKLSRAELSRLSDVSDMQIYRIEQGETGSKRDTLRAIARALKLEEADVLARAGYHAPSPVEPLHEEDCDENDPAYLTWQAFFHGVAPDLRPAMIGEVARLVRELQRRETTYGRRELPERTQGERDARVAELEEIKQAAIDEIRRQVEEFRRQIEDYKRGHGDGGEQ